MAANFLNQLLSGGGTPQRPAMYPREDNPEDQFALMDQAGWFGGGGGGEAIATQFDPMATDSRLGNAGTVEKEKNALNTLFQGAIFSGDLDKASQLAVTPEHQALLSVAYGQRMNRQAGGQGNLMADYQNAQNTNLARSRMEEDRRLKMRQMNDASAKTRAETLNMEIKDPTAADWSMGAQGMYNKRTGEAKPLPNGGVKLGPGERMGPDGSVQVVPGSKEDMKRKQQFSSDKGALETVERTSKALIDNINQIIGSDEDQAISEHPGMRGAVGYLDAKLPPLTGNQANAKALIKGLLDKTSVAGLQTLRQNGTAPGSITEKEWPIFQNYLGTIDPAQGEDQYRKQLAALRIGAREMLNNTRRNYQERYAGQGQQTDQAVGNSVKLPDGRVKTFPNAAAADAFKKAAGL